MAIILRVIYMIIFFEILSGFIFFSFISLLSLIIIPSLFGCAGFVLFWLIIFAFLIVFDISLKWLFIAAIVTYGILLLKRYNRYKNLPSYDEYLTSNADVYQNGVVCKHCGSHNVINVGLFGKSGRLRYYMCLQCRSWLYRFRIV